MDDIRGLPRGDPAGSDSLSAGNPWGRNGILLPPAFLAHAGLGVLEAHSDVPSGRSSLLLKSADVLVVSDIISILSCELILL